MTQSSPRTNFNSSRLVRLLAELSVADVAESKLAFAERLGQWLDFSDAIALHAAHDAANSLAALAALAAPATPSAARSAVGALPIDDEFARQRAALVDSITASCSPAGGETRIKWPTPKNGAAIELAAYEPYRRFYLAQQGEMEAIVRPLRSRVRQVLAKTCPALRRLAVLDESLDKILSGRERQMLSTLAARLEKRFAQRLKAHQLALAARGQMDDPAAQVLAGGWLAGFCQDVQAVLLAELDLRLQPTRGLIEALRNEAITH